MKKALLLSILFIFVFCGQKPAPAKIDIEKITNKNVVYEALTEDELAKFIQVFPVFKAEAEKKGVAWDKLSPANNPFDQTRALITASKDLSEIDAKMRAVGMGLNEFYPALMKTTLVFAAVMFDTAMTQAKGEMEKSKGEIAKLEAQLNDPKIPEAQKAMIRTALEAAKSITQGVAAMGSLYESVPKENKELVKKYFDQLKTLFNAN
jgi:hypothetical protein